MQLIASTNINANDVINVTTWMTGNSDAIFVTITNQNIFEAQLVFYNWKATFLCIQFFISDLSPEPLSFLNSKRVCECEMILFSAITMFHFASLMNIKY